MNQLPSLSKSYFRRKLLLPMLSLALFPCAGLCQDGLVQRRDGEGRLLTEGTYKNGKQDGRWRAWHPNGRLAYEGNFVQGRETGTSSSWSESGVLLYESVWTKAGSEELRREFYPDGKLRKRGTYRGGDRHFGLHQKFYPGGQEEQRIEFTDSVPSGLHKEWYADGKLRLEGRYRNGKQIGEWKEWYPDGRLSRLIEPAGGRRKIFTWYPNGRLKSVSEWEGEDLHGRSWSWREDGSLESTTGFRQGRQHGIHYEYSRDGKRLKDMVFEHGAVQPIEEILRPRAALSRDLSRN